MKSTKKAFSIIELIVVLMILSILMTIGFYSYSTYSRDSRNSARIMNLNTINKSLSLYEIKTGTYPNPTNYELVTHSGSVIWKQGFIGKTIFNLLKLDKVPLDPLTDHLYSYSVLKNNNKFEIGTIMEGDLLTSNRLNINNSQAFDGTNKKFKSYLFGNYSAKILKNQYGENIKILAIPSIISANKKITLLNDIINQNILIYNGSKLLPDTYKNISLEQNSISGIKMDNILLFEGNYKKLFSSFENKKLLLHKLKKAYKGSVFENDELIKRIIDFDIKNNNSIEETNLLFEKIFVN